MNELVITLLLSSPYHIVNRAPQTSWFVLVFIILNPLFCQGPCKHAWHTLQLLFGGKHAEGVSLVSVLGYMKGSIPPLHAGSVVACDHMPIC